MSACPAIARASSANEVKLQIVKTTWWPASCASPWAAADAASTSSTARSVTVRTTSGHPAAGGGGDAGPVGPQRRALAPGGAHHDQDERDGHADLRQRGAERRPAMPMPAA